jgi:hypothetical protein
MKPDSLAFRYSKLLIIKEFRESMATKQWTLGCTWFLVAGCSPAR